MRRAVVYQAVLAGVLLAAFLLFLPFAGLVMGAAFGIDTTVRP